MDDSDSKGKARYPTGIVVAVALGAFLAGGIAGAVGTATIRTPTEAQAPAISDEAQTEEVPAHAEEDVTPKEAEDVVTLAEFKRLRKRMTYKEVVRIIGAEGVEESRIDVGGPVSVTYGWANLPDADTSSFYECAGIQCKSFMTADFEGGKLSGLSQVALR